MLDSQAMGELAWAFEFTSHKLGPLSGMTLSECTSLANYECVPGVAATGLLSAK